jgi:hypothetical protein
VSAQELHQAVNGVALAERLDIFLLYRERFGKRPERLALSHAEIDALKAGDLLTFDLHKLAAGETAPFYRGIPVVVQGDRHGR